MIRGGQPGEEYAFDRDEVKEVEYLGRQGAPGAEDERGV